MRRSCLAIGLALAAALGWAAFDPPAPREARASSLQPPMAVTGAPGENTCADCHGSDAGDGSVVITAPQRYVPAQSYTITVTVQDPGQRRWGFELTALSDAQQTFAGSLANSTVHTRTQNHPNGRTYISHTSNLLNDGSANDGTYSFNAGPVSWTFQWAAPAQGTGSVTFYAAGNGANNNGLQTGDFIYTTSATSLEDTTTPVTTTTWGKIKQLFR